MAVNTAKVIVVAPLLVNYWVSNRLALIARSFNASVMYPG